MSTDHYHYFPTLGDLWIQCMRDILREGELVKDDKRDLLELRNYYFTIEKTSDNDPIVAKYADASRIALMREKYSSCSILPGYNISYGRLIYDNRGVNQIDWVVERLIRKPETKSATISLHIPGENELSCLSLLDFKLRKGILDMSAVYRSQNAFSSQPGNFVALSDIQKNVAERIHAQIGVIEGVVLSAHIYQENWLSAQKTIDEYDKKVLS